MGVGAAGVMRVRVALCDDGDDFIHHSNLGAGCDVAYRYDSEIIISRLDELTGYLDAGDVE